MSDETQKSRKRTEWSEDRTLMASERSYSSWTGTALGCVGVAIGMHAVFGELAPLWLPKAVASGFLLAALIFAWTARNRACATRNRLRAHDAEIGDNLSYTLVSGLIVLAILATGAVLWRV
jgi:putative membrane protein